MRFAFDGTDYEIDLNAKNAIAFGKQLAPYMEHARKADQAQPRRGGRTAVNRCVQVLRNAAYFGRWIPPRLRLEEPILSFASQVKKLRPRAPSATSA